MKKRMSEEELEQLRGIIDSLASRVEESERRVRETLGVEMANVRRSVEELRNTQPDVLIADFKEAVSLLRAALVSAKYLKDHEGQLEEVLKLQYSQVEWLESLKRSVADEWGRIKAEKENLEEMRRQIEGWRRELEAKEARLATYEQEVRELEKQKEELEQKIRELNDRYPLALEEIRSKLDETMKELDRRFRIREIRLERLYRLEEEKREKLAKLESERAVIEELKKQAYSLVEEIQKLERQRSLLRAEISKLENDRRELERLKQELRSNVLKGA